MSRIRSTNTSLERAVFSYLRKHKVYFRKHYRKAPGCPDVALPSKKRAVFIDGDFWHGWKFEQMKKRLPSGYWQDKIEANIKRDKRNRAALRRQGWKLLRLWQHDLKKDPDKALNKIKIFLTEKD